MGRKRNSKKNEEFIDYNPLDTMVPDNYVEEEPLEKTMQIMTPEDFKRLTDLGIGDIDSKDAPDEEVEIEHADRLIETDIPDDEYITLDAYGTQDRVDNNDELEDTFAIELPTLKHIDEDGFDIEELSSDEDDSNSELELPIFKDKDDSNDEIEELFSDEEDKEDEYDDLFQDIFSDEENIHNKYEALKDFEKVADDLEEDTSLFDNDEEKDSTIQNLDEKVDSEDDISLEEDEEDTSSDTDDAIDISQFGDDLEDEPIVEHQTLNNNSNDLEDIDFNGSVIEDTVELFNSNFNEDNINDTIEDNELLPESIPENSIEEHESDEDAIDLDLDFDDTIVMKPVSADYISPEINEPITLATGTIDEDENKELEDFLFDNIDSDNSTLTDSNFTDEDNGFLEEEDIRTVDDNKVISSLDDESFSDNGFARDLIELEQSKNIEDALKEAKNKNVNSLEENKNTNEEQKKVVVVTSQPAKKVVVNQKNPFQAVAPTSSTVAPVEQSVDSHLEENSKYVREISKTEKIIAAVVIVVIIILSIYLIVSTIDGEKVGTNETKTERLTTTSEQIITKPQSTTTTPKVITVPRNTTTSRSTYELIPNIPGN